MKHPLRFFLFLILASVVGCQQREKQPFANVKGMVTFDGKPIEKGQITFALEGRPPSTMEVVDGKFSGQAMVGSNKIMVSAKKRSATAPKLDKHADIQIKGYQEKMKREIGQPPVDFDPNMVEYIPEDWGQHSTHMQVVEGGITNEFEFDIKGPVIKPKK
jgi:hypothetical protein